MGYSDNAVWDARQHNDRVAAEDDRHQLAVREATPLLMGNDLESTSDCLVAFVAGITEHRTPLMVKTVALQGPISSAELLKLMLDRRGSDQLIAAATRELASRYLDDAYTRKVIDGMADRFMGVQ